MMADRKTFGIFIRTIVFTLPWIIVRQFLRMKIKEFLFWIDNEITFKE